MIKTIEWGLYIYAGESILTLWAAVKNLKKVIRYDSKRDVFKLDDGSLIENVKFDTTQIENNLKIYFVGNTTMSEKNCEKIFDFMNAAIAKVEEDIVDLKKSKKSSQLFVNRKLIARKVYGELKTNSAEKKEEIKPKPLNNNRKEGFALLVLAEILIWLTFIMMLTEKFAFPGNEALVISRICLIIGTIAVLAVHTFKMVRK